MANPLQDYRFLNKGWIKVPLTFAPGIFSFLTWMDFARQLPSLVKLCQLFAMKLNVSERQLQGLINKKNTSVAVFRLNSGQYQPLSL